MVDEQLVARANVGHARLDGCACGMSLVEILLEKLNTGYIDQGCELGEPRTEYASAQQIANELERSVIEETRLKCVDAMRGLAEDKRAEMPSGYLTVGPDSITLSGSVTKYPDTKASFTSYIVQMRGPGAEGQPGQPLCFAQCTSATKDRFILKGVPHDKVQLIAATLASSGVTMKPLLRLQFEPVDLDAVRAFHAATASCPVLPYFLKPSAEAPDDDSSEPPLSIPGFNEEQTEAVNAVAALARKPGGIAVIQGPPGTGKSHVIARGLVSLLGRDRGLLGRTLVVCNANAGLDSVLSKLAGSCADASQWACRIGDKENTSESLQSFYKGGVDADVSAFSVVFTTNYQAGRMKGPKVEGVAADLPPWTFETAIFEEASQVREVAVLKVLLRCCHTLKRIVFVGDHKQLPPITHETLEERGYGRSCMERVLEVRQAAPIMLKEQHRMAPDICEIVSRLSYNDALRNGPSVCGPDPARALGGAALIGIDLTALGESDKYVGSARSYKNDSEASAVQHVWEWLTQFSPGLGLGEDLRMFQQCAVIANHVEQTLAIQSLLTGVPHTLLKSPSRSGGGGHGSETNTKLQAVATVDKYQGSEREVIILSPLATRRAANRRLLNVGLSRAKKLVVIVGSLDKLARGHSTLWAPLVQHVKAKGKWIEVQKHDMEDLVGQLKEIAEGPPSSTQQIESRKRERPTGETSNPPLT